MDPDPAPDSALFVTDLQNGNKIIFLLSFYAHTFLKVHLHHSSKIGIYNEVTEQ
jgi:hypothetical protein